MSSALSYCSARMYDSSRVSSKTSRWAWLPPTAGELREYGLQVSRCVFVAVVGECADALDERQRDFLGECVSLSGEVSQAGLDAVQALFVSAGGECECGVGVSECGDRVWLRRGDACSLISSMG